MSARTTKRTRYSESLRQSIPRVYCDVCKRECTFETPLGPPVRDTDLVTRCDPCHLKHCHERAKIHAAAPTLLAFAECDHAWRSIDSRDALPTFRRHGFPAGRVFNVETAENYLGTLRSAGLFLAGSSVVKDAP